MVTTILISVQQVDLRKIYVYSVIDIQSYIGQSPPYNMGLTEQSFTCPHNCMTLRTTGFMDPVVESVL